MNVTINELITAIY